MIYTKIRKILIILFIQAVLTGGLLAQPGSSYNSKFMNQSIPDMMSPGQKYNLIITFENSGRTTWIPGEVKLRIYSDEDRMKSIWSVSEIDLSNKIDPGSSISFMINLVAPASEGVYHFISQLYNTAGYFGETGKQLEISVNKETGRTDSFNSSAFVEQTVPSVMEAGKPYKIMISYTNTGNTSWIKGSYRLVMLDAAGNYMTGINWGKFTVSLDENIKPGSSKVFNFEIIPVEAGTYTLQWRMASSETGLFGDATNPAVVKVNPVVKKKNEGKSGKQ